MRLAQARQGPGPARRSTPTSTPTCSPSPASTPGTFDDHVCRPGGLRGQRRPDPRRHPAQPRRDDLPPVATPDAAVLRGQTPVIADVLSNDYSPRSDVLVVQRSSTGDAWLRVSVVPGPLGPRRGDRARSTGDTPRAARVELHDQRRHARPPSASCPSSQKPAPKEQVAADRRGRRGAWSGLGDAVTIPVLDNDSHEPRASRSSSTRPASRSSPGGGQAFASGTVVRYVPEDRSLKAPRVGDPRVRRPTPRACAPGPSTGRVTVTIKPLPDAASSPTSRRRPAASRRASRPATPLTITVPTSGVDPDGDLTFVGGIVGEDGEAVDLTLGRVARLRRRDDPLRGLPAQRRHRGHPLPAARPLRRRRARASSGSASSSPATRSRPWPSRTTSSPRRAAPCTPTCSPTTSSPPATPSTFDDLSTLNDADVLKDFQRQKDDTFKVVAPEDGPAKVLTYGITDGLFDPSRVDADGARPEGLQQPADRGRRHRHRQAGRDLDPRRRPRQRPRPRRRPGEPEDHEVHRRRRRARGPQAAHPAATAGARRPLRHRGRRRRRRRWRSSTSRPAPTARPTSWTARPSRWAPTRPSRSRSATTSATRVAARSR